MLSENNRLEQQIEHLQSQIASLPEGKLICTFDNDYCKWYKSDGHTKSYISKKERPLAEQLALKKYLSLRLKELLSKKRAAQFYLSHYPASPSQANKLMEEHSEFQKLLANSFSPLSQELTDWMNSPNPGNPIHSEQLIHKSVSGNLVRSKSEALIDMTLYVNRIPFRYESPLTIHEVTIFPDFTIRHPQTGQFYYWEHFGLMDHPDYAKRAFNKLQYYYDAGIIPSINLITTYETKDSPLSSELVEKIIYHYFL